MIHSVVNTGRASCLGLPWPGLDRKAPNLSSSCRKPNRPATGNSTLKSHPGNLLVSDSDPIFLAPSWQYGLAWTSQANFASLINAWIKSRHITYYPIYQEDSGGSFHLFNENPLHFHRTLPNLIIILWVSYEQLGNLLRVTWQIYKWDLGSLRTEQILWIDQPS